MQFHLRTLIVWATFGPPLLALAWWFLPEGLTLAACLYFGTAGLLFAARWATICREAEQARQRALARERDMVATRDGVNA